MKLITERTDDILVQESKEDGNIYLEGIFLQADIKNKNGRIYPIDVLEADVNRYRKEFLDRNRAVGELGHPDAPKINLDRVSHLFTELNRDGSNIRGRARILKEQPHGKMAAGFVKEGVQLGMSSRALGAIEVTPRGSIVRKVHLCTAGDIVFDPSAPEAFVNGIMEGREWVWESGVLKECVLDGIKKNIKNTPSPRLAEQFLLAFSKAMR